LTNNFYSRLKINGIFVTNNLDCLKNVINLTSCIIVLKKYLAFSVTPVFVYSMFMLLRLILNGWLSSNLAGK